MNLNSQNIDEIVNGIITAVTVNPIAGGINIVEGVAKIFGWDPSTTTKTTVQTQLPSASQTATEAQKQQLLALALQVQSEQAQAQLAGEKLDDDILSGE